MIFKVFPSLNDFENLSKLKAESSDFANKFDYKDIVVNKPWGYEYLWFQNEAVAIWFLFIKGGHSTSLHCHALKRTSLIVLNGKIECTLLDDRYSIGVLETMVLEPCVFHSSKASSDDGTFLLEIETPPMKGDLIRVKDAYGRENAGYEKANEYSKDFILYDYLPFNADNKNDWNFKNVRIRLETGNSNIKNGNLIVPISGRVRSGSKVIIDCGEAVSIGNEIKQDELNDTGSQFLVFDKK